MIKLDNKSHFSDLYTTQDVARLFGVTPMTINLWRNAGLSAIIIPGSRFAAQGRPAVRFERRDIVAWATQTGRRIRASGNALREAA
jgi:hypothetical protein